MHNRANSLMSSAWSDRNCHLPVTAWEFDRNVKKNSPLCRRMGSRIRQNRTVKMQSVPKAHSSRESSPRQVGCWFQWFADALESLCRKVMKYTEPQWFLRATLGEMRHIFIQSWPCKQSRSTLSCQIDVKICCKLGRYVEATNWEGYAANWNHGELVCVELPFSWRFPRSSYA